MPLIAVYGASGFGREVMPLVKAEANEQNSKFIFVDDAKANGTSILSFDEFVQYPEPEKQIVIAIASSQVREDLARKCGVSNVPVLSVKANNAVVLDDVMIGEGSILCSFTHLTSNVKIGRHFHANIYSYVAHDCIIGDYVTFAPGVKCNGNVHIDDHAYIGTGAILRQGSPDKPLHIGSGAVVGMGAVVTKDVGAGQTVIGNPARPMQAR